MKKQITKFSIHQTSKVLAILYFVLIAIFAIPAGILTLMDANTETPALVFFLAPFIYLAIIYIMTSFSLWLYNVLAKTIGGIEFTVHDVEE